MGLTNAAVKAAQPRAARYKLADDDGLYLLVLPSGVKSWRWRRYVGGREQVITLGQYPDVSLAQARAARDAARASAGAPEAPPSRTLREVAADWYAAQAPIWKPRHADRVKFSLDKEVMPALGDRPIGSLTAPEILAVLRPIQDRGAVDLAHRTRQRIEAIYDFAVAAGEAQGNPAASLGDALVRFVPTGRRPAVVTIEAARSALAAAEGTRARLVTRLAVRLLALTALRPGEVRLGEWQEIEGLDGAEPVWRVPPARLKHVQARAAAITEHVVPLSRQAVEALRELRKLAPGALMFPSASHARRAMGENALVAVMKRAGLSGQQVPHGWRATFSTIINERFPADRAIIDLMLAHAPKDQVQAAYNRATHAQRRRELAQAWADLLLEGLPTAAELVTGRGRP